MSARHIAIVGGGISGLAVAEAVRRRSLEAGQSVRVSVLEAQPHTGGKIRSAKESGFVVDTGPHGFLDKEPKMFELIERLGLSDQLIKANEASAKRYVLREGALREIPGSPPKFLVSDVLPFGARMRVLMEPWAKGPPNDEESVWSFAARRIGPGAADVLIDAMVTGIYGGDPKRLSLTAAFPRMFEIESQYGSLIKAQIALAKEKKGSAAGGPTGSMHSFKSGLGVLTDALAALPDIEIHKAFSVQALERKDGGYVLRSDSDQLQADGVVLAAPASVASRLLEPHSALAEVLQRVEYASVAVVLQAFNNSDVGRPVDGFGFLIPNGESRSILGSIWASAVFPEHVPQGQQLFRSILGGVRHPEHSEGSDEELLARARSELEPLMRIAPAAQPTFSRVLRWPMGIPQYNLGHGEIVQAADALEVELPGIFVTGNAFRGVAMLNCVAYADTIAQRAVRFLLQQSPATSAA